MAEEFSIVINPLKEIRLDMSTGTGEAVFETEEVDGFIESIAFDSEGEMALVVEAEEMLGEPILDLRTATRYFTPRISPTDSNGDRFNFGAQKIAIKGNLKVSLKGAPGKRAAMRILIANK